MKFISTRGGGDPLSFTEAVATGLAPDGGLIIPQSLPDIRDHLSAWSALSYPALTEAFFSLFATDIPSDALHVAVERAYANWDHEGIAPLHFLDDRTAVLELFHGPTLAFKDFALQLLGEFYALQIERTGIPINVLGATSGDTGAAAIEGMRGKDGVSIFILYPDGGVSPLQERQMACTGDSSVHPIAIQGSFDDAQHAIKDIFGDLDFRYAHHLSAVNSINLARVLAQCVYYLYAWFQLSPAQRENLTFVVPTGNFGNVLAGWWVQKMGLPVKGFQVATNQNDILYRLFTTGEYRVDAVAPSHAPSMDIQVASNFERFLSYHEQGDAVRVREIMTAFKATGNYTFENFDRDTFSASRTNDIEIEGIIREVFQKYNYVLDPHTACGFGSLPEEGTRIVLGTAHPAKFPSVVEKAIGESVTHPRLEALKEQEIQKIPLSASTDDVKQYIVKILDKNGGTES